MSRHAKAQAIAARKTAREMAYRSAATRLWHKDGECEIDLMAPVSCADDSEGAYVQAWVWVPADQLEPVQ